MFKSLKNIAENLSFFKSKKWKTFIFSRKSNSKEKNALEGKYPQNIFKNAGAFQIFHQIFSEFNSHTSLSFLYHKMSEDENPPLIVVRDASFREWFNKQDYTIKIDRTPRSLIYTTTPERELIYKLYKEKILEGF